MKRTNFTYKIFTEVEFDEATVDRLIRYSKSHYDFKCKHASKPGPEGFLNGMKNQFQGIEPKLFKGTYSLSIENLNLLCKICENDSSANDLFNVFYTLLSEADIQINRTRWAELNRN